MRGKACSGCCTRITPGITPAYAGKSIERRLQAIAGEDHPRVCGEKRIEQSDELAMEGSPRVCGEKSVAAPRGYAARGSPPRMRGKARWISCEIRRQRITPAYAGKRKMLDEIWQCKRDHPRVCGEKVSIEPRSACVQGSPPRMRGKAEKNGIFCPGVGITPAYAGKSGVGGRCCCRF